MFFFLDLSFPDQQIHTFTDHLFDISCWSIFAPLRQNNVKGAPNTGARQPWRNFLLMCALSPSPTDCVGQNHDFFSPTRRRARWGHLLLIKWCLRNDDEKASWLIQHLKAVSFRMWNERTLEHCTNVQAPVLAFRLNTGAYSRQDRKTKIPHPTCNTAPTASNLTQLNK